MKPKPKVHFERAFYIKLGRQGVWETDSLANGKLRLGWSRQTTEDINSGRWEIVESELRHESAEKRGKATTDLNRLKDIAQSTSADIWITFSQSKLWWAHLEDGPVMEDEISKFRCTRGAWSDKGIDGTILFANELPGVIAQLQGFRGTACRVGHLDILLRVINGEPSPDLQLLSKRRTALIEHVSHCIQSLHWKDFETLVDLVFRASGWRRVGILGQTQKAIDLELVEPISGDRYQVQIKSRASRSELEDAVSAFPSENYRCLYFVVHSPDPSLAKMNEIPEGIEFVGPRRLAELAVDGGLTRWLMDKVW